MAVHLTAFPRLLEWFFANKKAPSKRSGLDTIRHDGYNENRKRHCDKRLTLFSKRLLWKSRHRAGWRFLLFTTKLSVMVLRPTWKVNVKRMASPPFGKWGQPPAVVCSACRQKRLLQNTTKYNKLQGINQARRERNVLAGLLYYRLKIKPYRLKFHTIPVLHPYILS